MERAFLPLVPYKLCQLRNSTWRHLLCWNVISKNLSLLHGINICPLKNLYMNVHSSFLHNSQKLETTQISISRWIFFHELYSYNVILFIKKGWTVDIWHKDEYKQCYPKWKRDCTEWFHLHEILEMVKYSDIKINGCLRLGSEVGRIACKWGTGEFEEWWQVLYLECCGGYLSIYNCQISSNCPLQLCVLYYIQSIPQ